MSAILEHNIQAEINGWKEKGLTPSTLRIGPDIAEQLRLEYGNIPIEFMGLQVKQWPEPGFFCCGPWDYSSSKAKP